MRYTAAFSFYIAFAKIRKADGKIYYRIKICNFDFVFVLPSRRSHTLVTRFWQLLQNSQRWVASAIDSLCQVHTY